MLVSSLPPTSSFPEAIAFRAKHSAQDVVYLWLDAQGHEVTVTFKELDNATRRVANSFGDLAGGGVDEVVAVIGNVDTLVQQTLVLGLTCANLVVSSRLSTTTIRPALKHSFIAAICYLSTASAYGDSPPPQVHQLPPNLDLQIDFVRVGRWDRRRAEDITFRL